jgi:hypothetical protein
MAASNRYQSPIVRVRDLSVVSSALGASWLPDGSLLFASDPRGRFVVLQNGTLSDATKLQPETAHTSFR